MRLLPQAVTPRRGVRRADGRPNQYSFLRHYDDVAVLNLHILQGGKLLQIQHPNDGAVETKAHSGFVSQKAT
jgi:hypothetical protein